MDTIVVAIIVGSFGGFLGSAIGPFVGHVFNEWERKDVRKERRQEHLREMLEGRIADYRHLNSGIFTMYVSVKSLNVSPAQAHYDFMIQAVKRGMVWEPHRITDGQLREDADLLNDRLNVIFGEISSVRAQDVDGWHREQLDRLQRAEEIAKNIQLRLDELDW